MELVWPSTKVHLYTIEAARIKESVGRERIQRNKVAWRELRSLQEILCDLHAGQFGRAPERHNAAVIAASRWDLLAAAAQRQGLALDSLCEVPSRVRPLLVSLSTRSAPSPGSPKSSGFCFSLLAASSSSTRAPSTATGVREAETQSLATTDVRSDVTGLLDSLGPFQSVSAERGRRSREQLEQLALELGDQLDQEYTSLMASIEEVQTLMEAEMAGDAQMPSIEELEAFTVKVDQAIEQIREETTTVIEEETVEPAIGKQQSSNVALQTEKKPLALQEEQAASQVVAARPRWSDMCSDSEHEEALFGVGAGLQCPCPPQSQVKGSDAAKAQCSRCHRYLGRSFFSRRAWRQVRGLGADRALESATCQDCGGQNGDGAVDSRHDRPKPMRPAR